jgi:hypothetical protein
MDMFLTDLLNHWGFDEPERYLKAAPEEPQQQQQASQQVLPTTTTGNPLVDAVQSGQLPSVGMANALQSQVAADGGMSMMANLMPGTSMAPGTNTDAQLEALDNGSIDPTAATGPVQ